MGENARTAQGIAGVLLDRLIRDEGVGGSNPLTPTNKISYLAKRQQPFRTVSAGRLTWRPCSVSPRQRVTDPLVLVRAMMPIDTFQHFDCHSEEVGSLILVRPALHRPGNGRVPQDMGRHVSKFENALRTLLTGSPPNSITDVREIPSRGQLRRLLFRLRTGQRVEFHALVERGSRRLFLFMTSSAERGFTVHCLMESRRISHVPGSS